MPDKHIRIMPAKLRAMIKAAYADGFDDCLLSTAYSPASATPEEKADAAWAGSVSQDNLDQDLAKAAQSGVLE